MKLREGSKIILESIGPEHAERVFEWYYDAAYERFFREFDEPLSLEDCKNFNQIMLRSGVEAFAIIEKETGTAIGIMTFCVLKRKSGVFRAGLMIDKKYQHQTHTIEAFIIIGDYGLHRRGFNKMTVEFLEEDKHIERITAFGGFVKEAVLKDEAVMRGKFVNEVRYALFKDVYDKLYGNYFDEITI